MALNNIITDKLKELKESNWRNGFNRTWEMEVCDALHQSGLGSFSDDFWSDFINFGVKSCPNKVRLANKWFDGEMSIIELIEEIDVQSEKEGAFVMPAWGTYGT